MFTKSLFTAGAIAIAATSAGAFEFKSTEVYGGWSRVSPDLAAFDLDGFNAGIDSTAMVSDQFGLEFGLGYASPDTLGGAGLDNMFRLSIAGNYHFADGFYAGAFWDASYADGGLNEWAHVYGLQGGYQKDAIDVKVFYGIGDYSDLGAPEDSDSYGIDFTYSLQNNLDLGAYYLKEDLAGTSMDQYGITVGYLLAPNQTSNIPIYIVGSLGRMDGSTSDGNQIGIALSFPLSGDVKKGRKSFHSRSAFHNAFATAGTLY